MLTQISLTNFKAFRTARIPLAPLTLLTGLNGSGKSTVLQSLAMLRQSEETGFLPSWLLNGELVELGIGSDLLHDNSTTDQILRLELTTDLSRSSTSYPSICWAARYEPLSDVLTPASEDHPIDLTSLNLFQPRFQYLRAWSRRGWCRELICHIICGLKQGVSLRSTGAFHCIACGITFHSAVA